MAKLSKEEIAWIKEQFRITKNLAESMTEALDGTRSWLFDGNDYKNVFEEYDEARKIFENNKGTAILSLKEFPFNCPESFETYEVYRILYSLSGECSKAIAYLENTKSPLISEESKGELKSLRQEIEKISIKLEPNIEKNYIFAIDSFEDGHVLGASLIASRLIEYYLDKLKGNGIEEQIQSIRSKMRSDKKRQDVRDLEQNLIKSSKFARNLLSHNIHAIPEPEESLSLLSNCISLIKIMIE